MNFSSEMKRTLGDEFNYSYTENGALGYRTTQNPLVDLNFQVASLRSKSEEEIIKKFVPAYLDDRLLAMKWLFFLRDVRGGLGERRSFRILSRYLANTYPEMMAKLVPIIAKYGRWDDVLELYNTKVEIQVFTVVQSQFEKDLISMSTSDSCSLLAKWMPSAYSHNAETRIKGQYWASELYLCPDQNTSERRYRKALASLRNYLKVVETQMATQNWSEIDYEAVPSQANLRYNKAFLRHDLDRRSEFLAALKSGEAKINSSASYPHDIVHAYSQYADYRSWEPHYSEDPALEGMWKNLPNVISDSDQSVLVVRDGSGSMVCRIGGSQVTALEVSTALAIYFADHLTGEFHDQFITFSSRPQLIDLSHCTTLADKLNRTYAEDDCSNTNIVAVFDLVLTTAVRAHMDQKDLPTTIMILSDMEFDGNCQNWDSRLLQSISSKYAQYGYALPRLVFWNLNSRSGTIPLTQNDMGVALISGFSTSLAKMVMSDKLDPYEVLIETLNSDRYQAIEDLLTR